MEYRPQLGQLLGDYGVHAGILQADGVEHAAGCLRDARGGIAEARFAGRTLEGEGSQAIDIVIGRELMAVAEAAGGGDERVVELDPAERNAQSSHRISSFRNTGPSLQTRRGPFTVCFVQPMQAPKPQPMRTSKLSCPSAGLFSAAARSIASGPQA